MEALTTNMRWKAIEGVNLVALRLVLIAGLTRFYSSSEVGTYYFFTTILFFASGISGFWPILMVTARDLIQKDSAHTKQRISNAFALSAVWCLTLWVITLVTWILTREAFPDGWQALAPLTLLCIGIPGRSSSALLLAKDKIPLLSGLNIGADILTTSLVILAAFMKAPIWVPITLIASYYPIIGLVEWITSKARPEIKLSLVNLPALRALILAIIPLIVMSLATRLYCKIDVMLIEFYQGRAELGLYTVAYEFLDNLLVISNLLIGAIFPSAQKLIKENKKLFLPIYKHSLITLFKWLGPPALIIGIFSQPILEHGFGAEYGASAPTLALLMLAAILAWLNAPSGTIFLALNRQSLYMWGTLISLLVNLLLNIILLPTIGTIGAAIATVLTELALLSWSLTLIKKHLL